MSRKVNSERVTSLETVDLQWSQKEEGSMTSECARERLQVVCEDKVSIGAIDKMDRRRKGRREGVRWVRAKEKDEEKDYEQGQ